MTTRMNDNTPKPAPTTCFFCSRTPDNYEDEGTHTFTMFDEHPVSPGHTLIVLKRHVVSAFDMWPEEWAEIQEALLNARWHIERKHSPTGFNVGINVGEAAGQTVMHVHIHLIPRYTGDHPNPRGGVRGIFPSKADYTVKKT